VCIATAKNNYLPSITTWHHTSIQRLLIFNFRRQERNTSAIIMVLSYQRLIFLVAFTGCTTKKLKLKGQLAPWNPPTEHYAYAPWAPKAYSLDALENSKSWRIVFANQYDIETQHWSSLLCIKWYHQRRNVSLHGVLLRCLCLSGRGQS
jgi:hypothetical protein